MIKASYNDKEENEIEEGENSMEDNNVSKEIVDAEIVIEVETGDEVETKPTTTSSKEEIVEVENQIEIEVDADVEIETETKQEKKVEKEETLTPKEEKIIEKVIKQVPEIAQDVPKKEQANLAGEASQLLNKFKSYISSDNFDEKCENKANELGLEKSVVKNAFLKNVLGTIADTLNLAVHVAGDVLSGTLKFITRLIETIVGYGTSTLHKIINLLTLNCGTIAY